VAKPKKEKRQPSKAKVLYNRRLIKSLIFFIIGLLFSVIIAYLQNPAPESFLFTPLPAISSIILILFLWLSLKSVIDAYTFYLFARIVEVLRQEYPIKEKVGVAYKEMVPEYPTPPVSIPMKTERKPIATKIEQVPVLPSPQNVANVAQIQPVKQSKNAKKVCPYCGRELPYGDIHIVCPYCGRRLK